MIYVLIIAIIAGLVWGVLRMNSRQDSQFHRANYAEQALIEAERERDELRERVQVLERIVTDKNLPASKKTQQIEAEIEALNKLEGTSADKEETSQ